VGESDDRVFKIHVIAWKELIKEAKMEIELSDFH